MADHSDIVDRADNLMRRRHGFAASRHGTPIPRPAAAAESEDVKAGEDDDIPVLTDVASDFDETQAAALALDIARAIDQQLAYELPTLLEAVLASAAEELRAGINDTVEAALRDFRARHRQSRLPPDEHGRKD